MKSGLIKAVDLEFYINGGCTPDESQLVSETHPSHTPVGTARRSTYMGFLYRSANGCEGSA